MAETSPDSFIKTVRNELKKANNSVFVQLMYDDGSVTSPCKHAGLLWALEMLAVSKKYHKDAVEILFSLMEIDPGGKWSNRPKQTLREHIYCWWHLRSDIDLQSRITVLNNLLETKENLVWNMLFHIAFQSHYTVMDPTFPHWRNWGLEIDEQNAEQDGFAFRQFCAKRVLDKIGTDYIRWQKTLKHLYNIINKSTTSERFWKLLSSLEKNIPSDWTDTQREQLAGIIRELLSIDMIRSEEDKIFSEDTKKHLVDFMNSITPEDIVLQNAWLFSLQASKYFYNKFGSVKDEQWYISNAEAVKQIIKQYNFDGLKKLINITEKPFLIGKPLADQYGDQFFSEIIPAFLESENEKEQLFASAYLRYLCQGKREIWEQKYQSEKLNPLQWKSNTAIVFLNSFSYGKELWYWVDNFDESVQREFWTKQHGYYEYEWDDELIQFVYKHLVRFQNYDAALSLAVLDKNKKYNITVPQKLSLLQNIAQYVDTVSNSSYIVELFTSLQEQFNNGDITEEDQIQLAHLELQFIPLLYQYSFYGNEDCSPKILISYILKSAEFFVDLLRYAFGPNQEENPDYTEDELPNVAQFASSVYKILENLNQLPGEINGVIDSDYLCDWIQKSRELARKYARMNICDLKIGQLFAHCSNQTLQGQMPKIELMQILENINSEIMLKGFRIGLFNNRGVTRRHPFEGGQQERDIASIYSEIARQTKIDYPHVSNVFDQLAIRYTEDALREDEQAQQRKIL
ncbi:MAG: hypothetical protein LBL13_04650 [Bacteroidales bacterium]|nr:hypothetical protein [Bacteroidales bacterium]